MWSNRSLRKWSFARYLGFDEGYIQDVQWSCGARALWLRSRERNGILRSVSDRDLMWSFGKSLNARWNVDSDLEHE